MKRPNLLDIAAGRVLVLDGAMGTGIQQRNLTASDYRGCENCSEVILLTRPDVIADIHHSFLAVGCDGVMTNTFGGSKITLDEFDLGNQTREINRTAAQIARTACEQFDKPDRPRFAIGSIGPGTKLP